MAYDREHEKRDVRRTQADLSSLVHQAAAGEVIVICDGDAEVAQIIAPPALRPASGFGSLRALIRMREDFDDPIPGFEPYGGDSVPK